MRVNRVGMISPRDRTSIMVAPPLQRLIHDDGELLLHRDGMKAQVGSDHIPRQRM